MAEVAKSRFFGWCQPHFDGDSFRRGLKAWMMCQWDNLNYTDFDWCGVVSCTSKADRPLLVPRSQQVQWFNEALMAVVLVQRLIVAACQLVFFSLVSVAEWLMNGLNETP